MADLQTILVQLETALENSPGMQAGRYSVGKSGADGKFGPSTESAIRAFQQDESINVTGIVDDLTLSWLRYRQTCFTCLRD